MSRDPHSPGLLSLGCPGTPITRVSRARDAAGPPIPWDPHPPGAPSSGCPGTPIPRTSIPRAPIAPPQVPHPCGIPPSRFREPLLRTPRPAVFSADKVPAGLDAIVIGSGIGGLAVAVLLAKAGRRVLVLEQHGKLGGCCHTFSEKGFEFDAGKRGRGEGDARMGREPAQDPKPLGGNPGTLPPRREPGSQCHPQHAPSTLLGRVVASRRRALPRNSPAEREHGHGAAVATLLSQHAPSL